jgi:hypothetical protein
MSVIVAANSASANTTTLNCSMAFRAIYAANTSLSRIQYVLNTGPTNTTPSSTACTLPLLYESHGILLLAQWGQSDVLSFNSTTGQYLAATAVPTESDIVGLFPYPTDNIVMLITQSQGQGLVATDLFANGTMWAIYNPGYIGSVNAMTANSIITGGNTNPSVIKFDVQSGLPDWHTVLSFAGVGPGSVSYVDSEEGLYIIIHAAQVYLLDQATGRVLASFLTTMGGLDGQVQSEVFVPTGASRREGNLILGMLGQVAMITLRSK